jgi:hypothetical protein
MDAPNESASPSKATTVGSRVVISIKAVIAGWGIFLGLCFCLIVLRVIVDHNVWANGGNPFVALYLVGLGSAVVVFVAWLVVALPLAVFVPDRSIFWKQGFLAFIGALAGPLIICLGAIYQLHSNPTIRIYQPWAYILSGVAFPGIPSAIIGGITGAVASHLHARKLKTEG